MLCRAFAIFTRLAGKFWCIFISIESYFWSDENFAISNSHDFCVDSPAAAATVDSFVWQSDVLSLLSSTRRDFQLCCGLCTICYFFTRLTGKGSASFCLLCRTRSSRSSWWTSSLTWRWYTAAQVICIWVVLRSTVDALFFWLMVIVTYCQLNGLISHESNCGGKGCN